MNQHLEMLLQQFTERKLMKLHVKGVKKGATIDDARLHEPHS
jgi:hypothetical protein